MIELERLTNKVMTMQGSQFLMIMLNLVLYWIKIDL